MRGHWLVAVSREPDRLNQLSGDHYTLPEPPWFLEDQAGFAVAEPEATLWLRARPDQRGDLSRASEPGGVRAHDALIRRYKRRVTDGQQQ